jgi:predicted kinase
LITHGFSGSGKSTCAMELMEKEGMVRMRSDVERQRLAIRFKAHDKYSSAMNDWVFSHMLELAKSSLQADMPVIVDATFLKLARRKPFRLLAEELSVDFEIIRCDATFEELCRRIRQRDSDPSEATIDVLKEQMKTHNPLTTDELQYVRQIGY